MRTSVFTAGLRRRGLSWRSSWRGCALAWPTTTWRYPSSGRSCPASRVPSSERTAGVHGGGRPQSRRWRHRQQHHQHQHQQRRRQQQQQRQQWCIFLQCVLLKILSLRELFTFSKFCCFILTFFFLFSFFLFFVVLKFHTFFISYFSFSNCARELLAILRSRHPPKNASGVGALHSVGPVRLPLRHEGERARVHAVSLIRLRVPEPLPSEHVSQVP